MQSRSTMWLKVTAVLIPLAGIILCILLFRSRPPRDKPTSFVDVVVGRELVPEVEEEGFSYQETDAKGPFRWTNGHGKLVIPIDKTKPPEALLVELVTYRTGKKARLEVVVNNRPLFQDDIPVGPWKGTFDLRGVDLGDRVSLDLISDTFTNAKNVSDDPRQLGVLVKAIKLLSSREGARDKSP
jgi:hypothetical protein